MPLHPFITLLIEKQKAAGWPGLAAGSPDDARALVAQARTAIGTGPAMEVKSLQIPTRAGQVPARLYTPSEHTSNITVYAHGGGWVVGALDDYDTLARTLAARANTIVLLPDYRLAPEHVYPAGLQDVEDVLFWASSGAVTPQRALPLIVAGDSAGANLVTVAARRLKDRLSIALQVLVYPVTDCDMDNQSYRTHGEGLPLTAKDMAWFFSHYAKREEWAHPDISPLRAKSLEGMPPAFVLLAEYDVLRDEGAAYAERLKAAGIPVQLTEYSGATHGFLRLHNLFDVADGALNEMAEAIRACAAKTGGTR